MKYRRVLLLWALVLLALGAAVVSDGCARSRAGGPAKRATLPTKYVNPDLLAETDALEESLSDSNMRILDLRAPEQYKNGHIEGAVNVALADTDDKNSKVPSEIASQDQIESWLGGLGVTRDTNVVLVDQQITPIVGRLFWVLEYMGHPKVSVVNGGFAKWTAEKRPVTKEVPKVDPTEYNAEPVERVLATKEEVREAIESDDAVLVDTRPLVEYLPGHLPGAVRQDWVVLLTADDTPVMKPAAELQKLMDDAGITKDKDLVLY